MACPKHALFHACHELGKLPFFGRGSARREVQEWRATVEARGRLLGGWLAKFEATDATQPERTANAEKIYANFRQIAGSLRDEWAADLRDGRTRVVGAPMCVHGAARTPGLTRDCPFCNRRAPAPAVAASASLHTQTVSLRVLWDDTKKWVNQIRKEVATAERLLRVLQVDKAQLTLWYSAVPASAASTVELRRRVAAFYRQRESKPFRPPLPQAPIVQQPAEAAPQRAAARQ